MDGEERTAQLGIRRTENEVERPPPHLLRRWQRGRPLIQIAPF
jgi:hypothetical protein